MTGTMTSQTITKPAIHPGHRRDFDVPGTSIVVTVANDSRPGAHVWRIETRSNTGLMAAYCKSYTDEALCRSEARRIVKAFAAGQRPRTLDEGPEPQPTPTPVVSGRTWNQVAYELDQEQRRRGQWRNQPRIDALAAELATIDFPNAA
jgi:hypothetical protein